MNLGVTVLWPRRPRVQPRCPVGAQPCWRGEDELQAAKRGAPLSFFPSELWSCRQSRPGSQRPKEAADFTAAEDHGSRLFWKGASPGSSPSCVRERISCFQVMQGVGEVRSGSSLPASSGFEPSLPSLSQAYKLFPGRATPWASNGAWLARSSPVPGGGSWSRRFSWVLPLASAKEVWSPKPCSHLQSLPCALHRRGESSLGGEPGADFPGKGKEGGGGF